MDHRLNYIGAGVFAFTLLAAAWGQRNAAEVYAKAGSEMVDLSLQDVNGMWRAVLNPAGQMPDSVARIVRNQGRARSLLIRAASMEYCDFGLDGEVNPTTSTPHVMTMDRGYKLLLADAMLRLQEKDYDNAVRSVQAVYGMANHIRWDRRESSSNKSMWMILEADRLLEHAQSIGALDPGRSAGLARACRALDMRDPTGTADMAAATIDRALNWYEDLYAQGKTEQLEDYLAMFDGEEAADLDAIRPEEFYRTLDAGAAMLDEAVSVLVGITDKKEQKEKLKQILEAFEDQELAALLFPWRENVVQWAWQLDKARQTVEERLRVLETIAKGEVGLEETANAAFWYVRGARALEEIPREHWGELVELFATGKGQLKAGGGEAARWLEQVAVAIAIFDEAATIQRCDFSAVRRDEIGHEHAAHLAPDYVVGVKEAFELYHARAAAQLLAGETDAAGKDLSVCLKMIRHLGRDSVMASSICAHVGFSRTVELCDDMLKRPGVTQACRSGLGEAYKHLSPADPFGYHRSVSETRKDLPSEVTRSIGGQLGDEVGEAIDDIVRRWTGDQLVCGVMAVDMMTSHSGAGPNSGTEAIERSMRNQRSRCFLNSILGEDFVKEAETNAALIATLLQDGDTESVRTWPRFDRGPIEVLRRDARREFRKAHRMILSMLKEGS